jgi:hypothetical protein
MPTRVIINRHIRTLRGKAGYHPHLPRRRVRCAQRAEVQRSVHDLASLQYQRMLAHAWPPSATSRASGSAVPHMEHWATSSGRGRSRCAAAGGSASVSRGPTGSCSGPVSRGSGIADEAGRAMIPPRGAQVTRPPALLAKPGKPAGGDVIGQARSYQARSWWAARSYQARTSKVATHTRVTQDKTAKSLTSRRKSLRSHRRQHPGLRRTNGRPVAAVPAFGCGLVCHC